MCRAVAADPELELVAAVDPGRGRPDRARSPGSTSTSRSAAEAEHLEPAADVMVDFTYLDAARENLAWCAEQGVHAVVGTTGFTDADLDALPRPTFTAATA